MVVMLARKNNSGLICMATKGDKVETHIIIQEYVLICTQTFRDRSIFSFLGKIWSDIENVRW